jgi:hypothetical protein
MPRFGDLCVTDEITMINKYYSLRGTLPVVHMMHCSHGNHAT